MILLKPRHSATLHTSPAEEEPDLLIKPWQIVAQSRLFQTLKQCSLCL